MADILAIFNNAFYYIQLRGSDSAGVFAAVLAALIALVGAPLFPPM